MWVSDHNQATIRNINDRSHHLHINLIKGHWIENEVLIVVGVAEVHPKDI